LKLKQERERKTEVQEMVPEGHTEKKKKRKHFTNNGGKKKKEVHVFVFFFFWWDCCRLVAICRIALSINKTLLKHY